MAGTVKSFSLTEDDAGREVLRLIIDYYDGDAPDLKWNVIWDATPVDVVLASPTAQPESQEPK